MKNQGDILEKIEQITRNTLHAPKIGVLGFCGAEKSTLCNEIFKNSLTRIEAYDRHITKRNQEIIFTDENGIKLIIIDSHEFNEYPQENQKSSEFYRNTILGFDLVLWLIDEGDKNQFENFKTHPTSLNHNTSTPLIFVITKIDRACNLEHKTSKITPNQMKYATSIEEDVSKKFHINRRNIISISSKKGYNIKPLESLIINTLSI